MISLRGVTKSFRDAGREVPVLRGVDLDVSAGEMVAILGASGSGKSTLLYVAGALDQDFGGEVVVADRPLRGLGAAERADLRNRSIGFVFQAFNLLPGLTALENVMLPGILRRGPGAPPVAQVRAGAREALGRVGLAAAAGARPGRLSGGSASVWPSPARSSPGPGCCSPTSRPGTSTPSPERRSSASSPAWRARASRCWW